MLKTLFFIFLISINSYTNIYALNILPKLSSSQKLFFADNIGAFCEYIAQDYLEKKFESNRYEIISNINYISKTYNISGEIDLAVYNKNKNKFDVIYEVKCWKNCSKAKCKANKQLIKFQRLLSHDKLAKDLNIFTSNKKFQSNLFYEIKTGVIMPKKEFSKQENELDLSLEEIQSLQTLLVNK